MRITPARPRDARRLARILGGWTEEMSWMPRIHSPADDLRHVRSMIANFDVLVGRTWRGAQGFLAQDGSLVHSLYLAPEARGKGLGSRLIAAAKARSAKLELWCFQANAAARRFYASHGFAEVEFTDGAENDEKLPDVRLVWPTPGDQG